MADDIAIKVEGVSKDFVLPHEKVTSVKSAFTNMFQRNKTKESQHALQGISFEVKKGEFFGIVGRNGSGKSTMLKILAGIYQPTKGKVHTYGKLVPFIELGVGFNPELTGRENVYLNGAMLGFSRREVDAMYDDIVAFAEIERFMDQKLKNYSSGMQVRLAFSMATRADADVLLVDEVLAVGDADFQRKCYDFFADLKKRGKTVVFVTHDMNAVREYCDRALLIEQSQVVAEGAADNIATKYTRMFMENIDDESQDDHKIVRWGDKSVIYTKVELASRRIRENDQLIIKLEAEVNEATHNPVCGFSIKNSAGVSLTGTNTVLEKKELGNYKKGDRFLLEWSIPNIFSDGKYTIDVAIARPDGVTVCDWWEDALTFTSVREQHTPFLIFSNVKLKT